MLEPNLWESKADTSGISFVRFWDLVSEMGLIKRNTARSLSVATRQVLSVEDNWEDLDITVMDLDAIIETFKRLRVNDYNTETINAYVNNFKRALNVYLEYLDDPAGWRKFAARESGQTLDTEVKSDWRMATGGDLQLVLDEIKSHRIFTISNSMDIPSYEKNLAISKENNWIFPIFGVHPWNASENVGRLDSLDQFIAQSPMIGEIGLDFYFVKDEDEYPSQLKIFEYFLSAAKDQNKIVHLHTKGAEEAVYEILLRYSLPRVLVHWYSGPIQTLEKFIDLGAYFTIGVELMFSDHIKSIANKIPLNRILTETDNPGGPKSYLGVPGTPSLLLEVIKSLAQVRGIGEDDIIQIVQANLLALIGDDPLLAGVKSILANSESKAV